MVNNGNYNPELTTPDVADSYSLKVVESTALTTDVGNGFAFRSWNYVRANARLTLDGPGDTICLDSGCGVSLVDKAWLTKQLPEVTISKIALPLPVRGIGISKHETSEYITVPIYLLGVQDTGSKSESKALACIRRELHLVDNLRANILVGNDILGPEEIIINIY